LAIIIQAEASAGTVNFCGQSAIVTPTSDVHLVHPLVADFAVAVFPEIMPVVVDIEAGFFAVSVEHEFVIGGRSLP
jgi:hypothetical protein